MDKGLLRTGVISNEELEKGKVLPSYERLKKGPVAVIECIQTIPCNPCEAACKFGAIEIGKPITNTPRLIEEKCIGCGQCIAACPGLAIFVEDYTFSNDEALVGMPYEYPYKPNNGDKVNTMNREGEIIGTGIIERVIDNDKNNRTVVLYVRVPKNMAREVRGIDFKGGAIYD